MIVFSMIFPYICFIFRLGLLEIILHFLLKFYMGNFATIDLYVLNIKLSILVCRQVAVKRMEQGRMGKCV